jgi:hypothetical protein
MALVRSFQVGPRAVHTQKLLNELAAAKLCLLSAASKAAYDAQLRGAGFQPALKLPPQYPPLAAPPVQPPQPPQPPQPRIAIAAAEDQPAEPIEFSPVPWWRPMVNLLIAALAVLAAVAAWGIVQSQWRTSAPLVTAPADPPPEPQPPPEPPPPQPVVQFQEASGEVNLAPATAVLSGGVELRTRGLTEHLTGFHSSEATAQWRFRLIEPGFFELELHYATAIDVEGAVLAATVGGQAKLCPLRSSGGADQFLADRFTLALPTSGEHTLALRLVRDLPPGLEGGDRLVLKSVRLIPIGREAPPVLVP